MQVWTALIAMLLLKYLQLKARFAWSLSNKRFNLDGTFQLVPIAPDTSAETVWSFGLTTFAQSTTGARHTPLVKRFVSDPVSLLRDLEGLERELRGRASRTMV